ncbi:putative ribonuclease H-like domain-containing protein [Tanacetum coccineum]
MHDKILQFKLQKVWTLVDLPNSKRAIGTKWVYRNKKDERDDIIFGSIKKSLSTEFEKMMHKKFQMSSMGELTFFLGLQVKQKEDGIFISHDKYVTEILKKFSFTDVKTTSTRMETQKALLKDEDVCACARYQVNPKVSHLHAVKRIFRYLKGQPKLGLWYLKDSPFDLVAYTDSDYAGASLDRKSTIGGCQFLGYRLILWQCKKQTVVAKSTTKDKYVTASSCCGQVLWIQSQLLDYEYNFMHTKIFIDNNSTICIVKNPVFHSKTKHIEIRHHFIRDSNEKELIQMVKIHTDKNVTDLLSKAFDSDLVSKRIKRIGELKNRKRDRVFGLKLELMLLMLLGINLQLLVKVNAARHNLLLLVMVNAGEGVKTINGEVQLQALVDGKKVIITEATMRRDLQLEDAKGTECLHNAIIFEQLTLMGAKTTAWNEFSSTMASAIICLATNQKFNFSMYIFESMVKNLDSARKFLMYPRFVQVFLDNLLEGMANHNRIYIAPSHIKKVFSNMKRQGKDFSGRVTPLKQRPRKPKRKDTEIPQSSVPVENVADEAVYEERDDNLERATTNATGLDAEQDRGNISKTQSKATPNEPSSIGTSSGGGLRRQDAMGDTIAYTRSENVSKFSNDPLLTRGNTLGSGEDSMQLNELMDLCENLQQRVLALETTKTTQAAEISSLKRKVKRLEKKGGSRTHRTYRLKRLYKVGLSRRVESFAEESLGEEDAFKHGRIADIDAYEDIYLVNVHTDKDVFGINDQDDANDQDNADMFGVNDLEGDEVVVESEAVAVTNTASTIPVIAATITEDEITLPQALAELKSVKPKVTTAITTTTKGIILQDISESITTTTTIPSKDRGKGIMIEEPLNMKKKYQINIDQQEAIRLQAAFDEEVRLAREKYEANVALIKEWNDIQAKIDADYQMAKQMQAEEQEELSIEEKSKLFVQLLEARKKHFAVKRAEEKRNMPPTRAQQRSIMCTYLKNMAGWKPKDLKNKSFANIQ